MLELSVENWDFLELSQHIKELILEEDWDPSGWMMSDAEEMREDSITVFTVVLVFTTVAMVKMLVWFVRVSTYKASTCSHRCSCVSAYSILSQVNWLPSHPHPAHSQHQHLNQVQRES